MTPSSLLTPSWLVVCFSLVNGQGELERRIIYKCKVEAEKDQIIQGRQLWWYLCEHYQLSEEDGQSQDFHDLFMLKNKGDLGQFKHNWDMTLLGLKVEVPDIVLESVFREQVRQSACMHEDMRQYKRLPRGDPNRTYQALYRLVERRLTEMHLERKLSTCSSPRTCTGCSVRCLLSMA